MEEEEEVSTAAMPSTKSLNWLITGAARGIGRGLTRSLLKSGHRVFLLDSNTEELTHLTTLLQPHARTSDSSLCDLRKPAEITAAVEKASRFFNGHLDVLVNNAAHTTDCGPAWSKGQDMKTVSLDEWSAFLETNLTAPFLVSQACLPLLEKTAQRDAGGNIIHISSRRARQSEPNCEGYATTKAGLIGLTHSMAVSLAPRGVRVNAVVPGWIHVENERKEADERGRRWEEGLTDRDHEWYLTGRVGRVEDVLRAVEYLV